VESHAVTEKHRERYLFMSRVFQDR
jgi:hypothetical protein